MFEKEAVDSFNCKKVLYKWETDKRSYIDGFKDGAEFGYNKCKEEMQRNGLALQSDMDKTIEQNVALKKQIEKMKCCGNCKYNSYWGNELHCNYGLKEALNEDRLVECKEMDKWEIKENDNNTKKIS